MLYANRKTRTGRLTLYPSAFLGLSRTQKIGLLRRQYRSEVIAPAQRKHSRRGTMQLRITLYQATSKHCFPISDINSTT